MPVEKNKSRYAMWRSESNTSVTDQYAHDSVGYKTFNNVIESILCIASKHKFIKQVDSGDIWQVDLEKNTTYPYFHLVTDNVQTTESEMIFNFQLVIMDLVEPGLNNEQQVQSDTLQILVDIVSAFKNGTIVSPIENGEVNPTYYIDGDFTFNPFTERFDNAVTGWTLDLGVQIEYLFPACFDPFEPNEDGSPANCVQ